MRKAIIAGNWKMFKTAAEAQAFANAVKERAAGAKTDVVVCAPFTALTSVAEALRGSNIKVGAQNMHWEQSGAFTGEISGVMLQELGVEYVIIGHSERRQYFAETDETVNRKIQAALSYGLTPIVCVGENLDERESDQTKAVCEKQVKAALAGLGAEQIQRIVIAYEPIWAIGTGKSSTSADANEVIAYIRAVIAEVAGAEIAANVRIQYGGSVKPANIREYMAMSDIDGALVGGASLEPESFLALVEGAQ